MALTLAQKDALSIDAGFISRARQAVAEHGVYMLALPGNQFQVDWAARLFYAGNRLDQVTANLMDELVCNPNVAGAANADGSDITDENLKAAVDSICEKYS